VNVQVCNSQGQAAPLLGLEKGNKLSEEGGW